jgi:PAS domain S-box-containing protein
MLDTFRVATAGRANGTFWRVAPGVARAQLARWVPAVACIGAALALSLILRGIVDPTGLFLVAVAISTWSAGWQVGVVAAGLATFTFDYFFTRPLHSVLVTPVDLPRLAAFTICALAVNWASDARRVAVARALHESERQFTALFADAPVGLAFINATGHAFKTNRKLQDMFGYSAQEFRRFPFTKVMHPPHADTDWNLFAELAHGTRRSYQLEKHCVTKSGRVLWARLTASLVCGDRGEPLFGIAVMEDITDRKHAESALRRTEAFLAEAQELSRSGSWRWQPSSGAVSFSREALRIMGLDPEQPTPSLAAIRERIHLADLPSVARTIRAATQHSGAYDLTVRLILSADTIQSVRAIGHATLDAFGEREYIGVLMDTTGHQT